MSGKIHRQLDSPMKTTCEQRAKQLLSLYSKATLNSYSIWRTTTFIPCPKISLLRENKGSSSF